MVFIDETGAKTNLTRLHRRCGRRKRLVDKVPHGHWVNVTYICGIKRNGIVAPMTFTGGTTKERFLQYVQEVLCPVLRKGDIVVMDNLQPHKQLAVQKLIRQCHAEVLYLPAYSPDLNPIELSFSKLKTLLRKEKIRDVDTLQKFLVRSQKLFTPNECKNYFKHAGYGIEKVEML